MKTITITLTDDNKIKLETSEPLSIPDITDITLSAILGAMNQALESAPKILDTGLLEQELFNMFNDAASTLLAQFAPSIDLRPNITEQAIMELEDKQLSMFEED